MQTEPKYDPADAIFYQRAFDILVNDAGASALDQTSFVLAYTEVEHRATEFRFGGHLGFGGKFWRNNGRFYVSCYREDATPEKTQVIQIVNAKLSALANELHPADY